MLAIAGHFPANPHQQNEPKSNREVIIVYCREPRRGGGHCSRPCPPGFAMCAFHEAGREKSPDHTEPTPPAPVDAQQSKYCGVIEGRSGRVCRRVIFKDMDCCTYHAVRRMPADK